jgi:drug/metabolite transporter (DMT)-like permease
MLNKNLALALGVLTGLVGLVAMVRLVAGAFDGGLSVFAWVVTLLAMVPWVAYAAVRARHGRLTPRDALVVTGLDVVGLVTVWLLVLGPVVALACSLAAFAVIWVRDWPERQPRGEDRFVRIEELTADERD